MRKAGPARGGGGMPRFAGRFAVGCAWLLFVFAAEASAAPAHKNTNGANAPTPDAAAAPPKTSGEAPAQSSLFPGTSSKQPISIEADHLEYYNKDQKAIYIGNVIAVQGDTTLKC